jgi:hypothetical protein
MNLLKNEENKMGTDDLNSTSQNTYPAIVVDVKEDYVLANVVVGRVEMDLKFPVGIFDYGPERGDRFVWNPTEDGTISRENIKIIESRDKPLLSEEALQRLERGLFTQFNPLILIWESTNGYDVCEGRGDIDGYRDVTGEQFFVDRRSAGLVQRASVVYRANDSKRKFTLDVTTQKNGIMRIAKKPLRCVRTEEKAKRVCLDVVVKYLDKENLSTRYIRNMNSDGWEKI